MHIQQMLSGTADLSSLDGPWLSIRVSRLAADESQDISALDREFLLFILGGDAVMEIAEQNITLSRGSAVSVTLGTKARLVGRNDGADVFETQLSVPTPLSDAGGATGLDQ